MLEKSLKVVLRSILDCVDMISSMYELRYGTYTYLREICGPYIYLKENLEDAEVIKTVKVRTLESGGSKLATLLGNGQVMMTDIYDGLSTTGFENVYRESMCAKVATEIGIPALNRKAFFISSNPDLSDHIPWSHLNDLFLVSDSFEKYAERGWHIIDSKNPGSVFVGYKASGNFNLELKSWETAVKPLIHDIKAIFAYEFPHGLDSENGAFVKKDDGSFELRYFTFDFGGTPGTTSCDYINHADDRAVFYKMTKISSMVWDYIDNSITTVLNREPGFEKREVFSFSSLAAKCFSQPEFILHTLHNAPGVYFPRCESHYSYVPFETRKWYPMDLKNPESSLPNYKSGNFNLELKTWENVIKPLISDIKTFIVCNTPTYNIAGVLMRKDDGSFELRNFHFDFNEVVYRSCIERDANAKEITKISSILSGYINSSIALILEHEPEFKDAKEEALLFAARAAKCFSQPEFIERTLDKDPGMYFPECESLDNNAINDSDVSWDSL